MITYTCTQYFPAWSASYQISNEASLSQRDQTGGTFDDSTNAPINNSHTVFQTIRNGQLLAISGCESSMGFTFSNTGSTSYSASHHTSVSSYGTCLGYEIYFTSSFGGFNCNVFDWPPVPYYEVRSCTSETTVAGPTHYTASESSSISQEAVTEQGITYFYDTVASTGYVSATATKYGRQTNATNDYFQQNSCENATSSYTIGTSTIYGTTYTYFTVSYSTAYGTGNTSNTSQGTSSTILTSVQSTTTTWTGGSNTVLTGISTYLDPGFLFGKNVGPSTLTASNGTSGSGSTSGTTKHSVVTTTTKTSIQSVRTTTLTNVTVISTSIGGGGPVTFHSVLSNSNTTTVISAVTVTQDGRYFTKHKKDKFNTFGFNFGFPGFGHPFWEMPEWVYNRSLANTVVIAEQGYYTTSDNVGNVATAGNEVIYIPTTSGTEFTDLGDIASTTTSVLLVTYNVVPLDIRQYDSEATTTGDIDVSAFGGGGFTNEYHTTGWAIKQYTYTANTFAFNPYTVTFNSTTFNTFTTSGNTTQNVFTSSSRTTTTVSVTCVSNTVSSTYSSANTFSDVSCNFSTCFTNFSTAGTFTGTTSYFIGETCFTFTTTRNQTVFFTTTRTTTTVGTATSRFTTSTSAQSYDFIPFPTDSTTTAETGSVITRTGSFSSFIGSGTTTTFQGNNGGFTFSSISGVGTTIPTTIEIPSTYHLETVLTTLSSTNRFDSFSTLTEFDNHEAIAPPGEFVRDVLRQLVEMPNITVYVNPSGTGGGVSSRSFSQVTPSQQTSWSGQTELGVTTNENLEGNKAVRDTFYLFGIGANGPGVVYNVDPNAAIGFRPATNDVNTGVMYFQPQFTVPTISTQIFNKGSATTTVGTTTAETFTSNVASTQQTVSTISFSDISLHQLVSCSIFVSNFEPLTVTTQRNLNSAWVEYTTATTSTTITTSMTTDASDVTTTYASSVAHPTPFRYTDTTYSQLSNNTIFLTRSGPAVYTTVEDIARYYSHDERFSPFEIFTSTTHSIPIAFNQSVTDTSHLRNEEGDGLFFRPDVAEGYEDSTNGILHPFVVGGFHPITSQTGYGVAVIPCSTVGSGNLENLSAIAYKATKYPRSGGAGITTVVTQTFHTNLLQTTYGETYNLGTQIAPVGTAAIIGALKRIITHDLSEMIAIEPITLFKAYSVDAFAAPNLFFVGQSASLTQNEKTQFGNAGTQLAKPYTTSVYIKWQTEDIFGI